MRSGKTVLLNDQPVYQTTLYLSNSMYTLSPFVSVRFSDAFYKQHLTKVQRAEFVQVDYQYPFPFLRYHIYIYLPEFTLEIGLDFEFLETVR